VRTHGRRALRALPCLLLLAVAARQAWLVAHDDLSPWSGGGFGMFSTADAGPTRHLHAFVVRPGLLREIAPPRHLEGLVEATLTLPGESNLRALAREVAALPTPDHGPASAVRLQVWQTLHDPVTLAPRNRLLRAYELPLGGG
jgi:hypothetical protein